MIELTDDPNINGNDYVTAKNMADVLNKAYPDHLWGVTCDGSTGIATVRNLRLSGQWGFILKLSEINTDPTLKCVKMAGGELLERYRLSRARFKQDEYEHLNMNHAGHFQADA